MKIDLLIFGAGGHAKVVSDCAGERYPDRVMLDKDGPAGQWAGIPVLPQGERTLEAWRDICPRAFVGIGDNRLRRALTERLEAAGFTLVTLVHPTAAVSPSARLEPGVLVGPRAVINAAAQVGRGSIVNTGAIVEHECVLGEFCHVSPGAALGGGSKLGELCWVCIGAAVSDHVSVGAGTVLGAGAAVVRSVPGNVLAAGVPAKVLKRLDNAG